MTAVNCDYCKWSVGARCARHDKPFNGSESCADQRANGNECGPDGDLFEPMTDTNTSGADVLATIARHRDTHKALSVADAYSEQEYPRLRDAHDAVAALIEREAALVAERDSLKRMWEQAEADLTQADKDNAELIAKAEALAAEVEALRVACKPLALMAPHYPTVRTFGNRPRTGEIHAVESPNYGVASIKVEDLWRAHDLLSRASAATGGGNG